MDLNVEENKFHSFQRDSKGIYFLLRLSENDRRIRKHNVTRSRNETYYMNNCDVEESCLINFYN